LNDCEVPQQIARKVQYVDLFPDWDGGVSKLLKMMHQQMMKQRN
jgi:hypothetical protein